MDDDSEPLIVIKNQNLDLKLRRAQSLVGTNQTKRNADFYPSDPQAWELFLARETFSQNCFEPCAGTGVVSEILKTHGYTVTSRDLHDYGYCPSGYDFLKSDFKCENIITNPPYVLCEEFIEKALELASEKVVMLVKLAFLEGQKRKGCYARWPLETVYVFSKRLSMYRDGIKGNRASGMIPFCMLCFNNKKPKDKEPVIRWL